MNLAALIALAAAPRVLSADYCADQLVLALANAEQIAALSPDAARDFSFLRDRAAGLPTARADAEEAVAREADIILRFWGGDAMRLERVGTEVVTLDYPSDFEGVKENIRVAAAALDRQQRGAALIALIDRRLDGLARRERLPLRALYVTPGGVTAGRDTMIDAIFIAAGVRNASAEAGLSLWPPLSAEELIAAPPDLIVAGFFSAKGEAVNHWSAARHPAFREIFSATPTVHLSADVLSCPGPQSIDAAETIRQVAIRFSRSADAD